MDMNALMSTMLSGDSVKNISSLTGSSQKDVQNVLAAALPSLLNGALGQAQNEQTAESFAGALADHAKNDTSDVGSFLTKVDLVDGGKIVNHLLGAGATATAEDVAERSGLSVAQTVKILAVVAPLLMSLLGQQTQQTQAQSSGSSPVSALMGSLLGNSDMSSVLVNLLGSSLGAVSSGSSSGSTGTGKKKKKKTGSGTQKEETGLMDILMGLLK